MPKFVWTGSSDNVAIDFYRVWLDGSILLDEIDPSSGTVNTFEYTPTHATADGEHSWQVQAIDTSGNFAFSAAWSFVIDTLAPQFIITDIDQTSTQIAAASNHNFQTYIVETTTPTLKGTGEIGSQVQLYIALSGGETLELQFTIGQAGNWEIKLPTLTENVLIYLTFVIKDQANNVSIIDRLPIKVTLPKATKAPIIPSLLENIISRPDLPQSPGRASTAIGLFESLRQERNVLIGILPEPVVQFITKTQNQPLSDWLVLIWILLSIALGLLYLATRLNSKLGLRQLAEFLWILGWIPIKGNKGLVFDPVKNQAFSLVKLSIYQIRAEFNTRNKELMSNRAGEYLLPILNPGEFKLDVKHQSGFFPCLEPRPEAATWQNYYLGEKFKLETSRELPVYKIPLTRVAGRAINQLPVIIKLASWSDKTSLLINLPICLILTLLFPSLVNLVSLALGVAVSIKRYPR